MSVLKMIVADDRRYVSAELHGSCAEWVYAACSREPKSIDELAKLLPEFGADCELHHLFGYTDSLALEPVDAGLIVVDLANKWVFAEDSYFGAHRSGSYETRTNGATITYAFPKEWQFVAEAKWFRYLQGGNLTPYSRADSSRKQIMADLATWNQPDFEEQHQLDSSQEPYTAEINDHDDWDPELAMINARFVTRACSLIDLKPKNPAEERDLKTLEIILKYDEEVAEAAYRISEAEKEITAWQIELQAVENLRAGKVEPRWELKRIALQGHIDAKQKSISRWSDKREEAEAMALELRKLVATQNYRKRLQSWDEDGDSADDALSDTPF